MVFDDAALEKAYCRLAYSHSLKPTSVCIFLYLLHLVSEYEYFLASALLGTVTSLWFVVVQDAPDAHNLYSHVTLLGHLMCMLAAAREGRTPPDFLYGAGLYISMVHLAAAPKWHRRAHMLLAALPALDFAVLQLCSDGPDRWRAGRHQQAWACVGATTPALLGRAALVLVRAFGVELFGSQLQQMHRALFLSAPPPNREPTALSALSPAPLSSLRLRYMDLAGYMEKPSLGAVATHTPTHSTTGLDDLYETTNHMRERDVHPLSLSFFDVRLEQEFRIEKFVAAYETSVTFLVVAMLGWAMLLPLAQFGIIPGNASVICTVLPGAQSEREPPPTAVVAATPP